MIDWAAFTWEAFSTLCTGVAAVIAATFVAVKQLGIIRRQAEVQELQLRHQLFDRRAAVFNGLREYLGAIIYGKVTPDFARFESFYLAIETSRFVFSEKVFLEFASLKAFVADYVELMENVRKGREIKGSRDKDTLAIKELELRRRYDALPALVEDEMSLVRLTRKYVLRSWRSRFVDWRTDRKNRGPALPLDTPAPNSES